jgi:hypothetical protein
MARRKGQLNSGLSSTSTDDLAENLDATPPARPLDAGEQAFQLATYNKQEIGKIRVEINHPLWAKEALNINLQLSWFVRFIVLIFLIILTISLIIFLLYSAYQLKNLNDILEDIRDSKSIIINENMLSQFNSLFFHARKMINLQLIISGSIAVITALGFFLKKLIVDKLLDYLSNKKS